MDKGNRKSLSDKPVVIIRKKVGPKSAPTGPTQTIPKTASPTMKVAKPALSPLPPQPVPQPIPPQVSAPPAGTETGPHRKEQDKQARRELLEVLRDRWPQAFPRANRQLKPLAIGISKDLATHLPEHPLRRIGGTIGIFKFLTGPLYYRAVLQ